MHTPGRALFDQLENRRLLAVTLINGVLKAIGTAGDDQISVSPATHFSPIPYTSQVEVDINGQFSTFNLSDITRIEIHGLAGDDHLFVSGLNRSNPRRGLADFPLGVFIKGDAGNDTIFGGLDDDSLHGAQRNDIIKGGLGDDHIKGGIGNDTLIGGDGDDDIHGLGLDQLSGGPGSNILQQD
jgi:Ca2+-binding RTX toxin-like protein